MEFPLQFIIASRTKFSAKKEKRWWEASLCLNSTHTALISHYTDEKHETQAFSIKSTFSSWETINRRRRKKNTSGEKSKKSNSNLAVVPAKCFLPLPEQEGHALQHSAWDTSAPSFLPHLTAVSPFFFF